MTVPIADSTDTWISSLTDPTISAQVSGFAATGSLTYSDLVSVLNTVVSGGTVTTDAFNDLQTIAANLNSGLATPDDVASEFIQLVDGATVDSNLSNGDGGYGSEANKYWTGGSSHSSTLGDLAVGTTSAHLTELIEKWFDGADLPNPTIYEDSSAVVYQASDLPLYGASKSAQIGDIAQGIAGDCELCAGLIEVIENDPSAMASMIVQEGAGVYGVRFYVDGNETWVTVNDELPNYTSGEGGGLVYMNAYNSDNPLWPDLVEKAYAELSATGLIGHPGQNSYTNISKIGNQADDVLPDLTDATSVNYFNYNDSNWSADKALIIQAIATGDDVLLETGSDSNPTYNDGLEELVADHAFAMIGYDASTGDFIVRNPWGDESAGYDQNYVPQFQVSTNAIVNVEGDVVIANTAFTGVEILTALEGFQNSSDYSDPQYVVAGVPVAVAALFAVIDTAGLAITQYMIELAGPGQIDLNGATNQATVAQTDDGEIVVSAGDLAKLTYVPGSYASAAPEGNAHILVSAYDGTTWSPSTDVSLTIGSEPVAVTPAVNIILAPSQQVGAATLFGGIGPVSGYEITNVSGGDFSETNIASSDLSSVTYTAPSAPGSFNFTVSDYDSSGHGSYTQTIDGLVGFSVADAIQNYDNGELSEAVGVADSAANIFANLDGLQTMLAAGVLQGIVVTDNTEPTETVTSAQQADDAGVLSLLAGQVNFNTTAPDIAWATATSGDFASAANWSGGIVPGSADEADISPAGAYTVSSTEDQTIADLTTESGATLDITGGTFDITNGTGSGANAGGIVVESGAVLALGGSFDNSGTIEALGGTIEISGAVSGPGTLSVGSGGVLELLGGGSADSFAVSSGGLVEIGSGAKLSGYAAGSGVTVEAISGGVASDTAVQSGGTLELIAGGRQSGTTVSSGGLLAVGSGAALSGFSASAGATLAVQSSGTLINAAVLGGGTAVVSSGGTASNTTVSSGGTLAVLSGGTADPTQVLAGGTEIVSSAGVDQRAQVSGGTQAVYGLAIGATIFSGGTQIVETGGTASGTTISSGGTLELLSGGSGAGAQLDAGGTQVIASGAIMSGAVVSSSATLEVETGATASTATVLAGGRLVVAAGGFDTGAIVSSGGAEIVSGGTDNATKILGGGSETISAGGTAFGAVISNGGTLTVLFGGTASGTVSAGGKLIVEAGGTASGATILKSGSIIVSSGGSTVGTMISSGGSETVSALDTASGTVVSSGGRLTVLSGGGADATAIQTGGSEIISAHGVDDGAEISGGSQLDDGVASGAIISSGSQVVASGGTASSTTLAGGSEIVSAHGTDIGAQITGGTQFDYGLASGGAVFAGALIVEAGGIASGMALSAGGETVSTHGTDLGARISGGTQIVAGLASGGTIFNGGTQAVAAGGIASTTTVSGGSQTVSAHGTAVKADVGTGGAEIVFGLDISATVAGQQSVSSGGVVSAAEIELGNEQVFKGGKTIAVHIAAGGEQTVASGGIASATTILSGGTQAVLSAGTGIGTTVSAGGTDQVGSASRDLGARISGGSQLVFGYASGTIVFAGSAVVSSGGTAVGTTVSSGGTAIVQSGGIASNTIVGAAGSLIVSYGGTADPTRISAGGSETIAAGGTDEGAQISGGIQLVYGFASGVTVSGGSQAVWSGGVASATVVKSRGTEVIAMSGAASGVTVSSGGVLELLGGGTVGGLSLLRGGTLELVSGAALSVTLSAGGILALGADESLGGYAVSSGVVVDVMSGGTDTGGSAGSGGKLIVEAGGNDSGTTIVKGGTEIVSSGGTTTSAMVSSGGELIVLSGGSGVDTTVASGGIAVVSSGGVFNVEAAATDDGSLTNSGTLNVAGGARLSFATNSLSNLRAINLSGSGGASATVALEQSLTLTGGGTVSLLGGGSNFIANSGTALTLTNINNTIAGAGVIGDAAMTLVNNGNVNANDSGGDLDIDAVIVNTGIMEAASGGVLDVDAGGTNRKTLEAINSGYLFIHDGATVVNSAVVEALSGGSMQLANGAISDTAAAVISVGSGAGAFMEEFRVFGGTLKAAAGGQFDIAGTGTVLSGVSIASGTLVEVGGFTDNDTLTLSGKTTNSGTVTADSGGTAIISGTLVDAGRGVVSASASGSLVQIAAGAVVSGGSVEAVDGVVEVGAGGTAHVSFSAGGSGGLVLDGTGAIAVVVSGFGVAAGGLSHQDHDESIDFRAIGSGATLSYTPANAADTSGTLTVSSSGTTASVTLIGSFTSGNFSAGTAADGSFEITDPAVIGGGRAVSSTPEAFPNNGIDLPALAFGARTTLAYAENTAGTGGLLTVTNGAGTANIALLGNYIAASFVAAGNGHGGTMISEAASPRQSLLTHPHTG